MWEINNKNILSLAKKIIFGLFISVFLIISSNSHVNAQQALSWQGDNISFDGKTFVKQAVENQPGKVFFIAKDGNKAHALMFEDDPKQATEAQYSTYDISEQNTLINKEDRGYVKVAAENSSSNVTTSCNVDGIGWILCPVLNKISEEMDKIQAIVASFMEVKPISTDQESTLFKSWMIMRNISNIVFIIVFLFIIFSYILSRGIDNYGIKKTLPKLIIGAVLVNLSFYICAVAVDLANIVGGGITEIFRNIQTQASNGQATQISWAELTKAALSGGTLAVAGAYAASFAFAGTGGILLTLASAVIGAAITLVVTFLILAGRQALIITLIIISPLAFVAMLMPNTETYYNKWLEMMKKLLVLLPMFSFLYGGAQLAGGIIIATAQDVFTLLLGMMVQVIPFLMLPKMIKDSDSLLSKLGDGLDNTIFNPLRNSTKGFFDTRIAQQKAAYGATEAKSWQLSKKLSQALDKSRRINEERTKSFTETQEAKYIQAKTNAKKGGLPFSTNNKLNKLKLQQQLTDLELANAKADLAIDNKETIANLFKQINSDPSKNINIALAKHSNLEQKLAKSSLYIRIKKSEDEMATGMQGEAYTAMLEKNTQLEYRGLQTSLVKASTGIYQTASRKDLQGAELAVLNKMIGEKAKEFKDVIQNTDTAMKYFKISSDDLIRLAKGDTSGGIKSIIGTSSSGTTYEFNIGDPVIQETAIKAILGTKRIDVLQDLVVKSGASGPLNKFASTIASEIFANGIPGSAVSFGNVTPDLIIQGKLNEETMSMLRFNNMVKGRYGDEVFAKQDKDETDLIIKTIKNAGALNNLFDPSTGKYIDKYDIKNGVEKLNKALIISNVKDYIAKAKETLSNPDVTRTMNKAQIGKFEELILLENSIDNMFK